MTIPETGSLPSIQVTPWPTEKPLTVVVAIFSILLWLLLIFSIFGIFYALMFAVIFFFAHVAFIYHVRGNGIRLGPEQFSDLHVSVETLARRMGFQKTPEAYLMQQGGALNALATKFFKSNMIVLFSDLIEACGENTAARDMIVAHELGHLKEGHLKWHWFLLPGLLLPFLGQALSRAREYTCDRYGLAGAGDKKGGLIGLTILAAGAERGPQVNLKAMADQVERLNTGWMTIGEWLSTHPPLSKRIIALDTELKPAFNYSQTGILRALGIIALVYFVPAFLIGMGMAAFTVLKLSKSGGQKGLFGMAFSKDYQSAQADMKKLADFLEAELISPQGLPKSQAELYQRWASLHANEPEPMDPFLKSRFLYVNYGDDFDLWTNGPDGKEGTDDDLIYMHSTRNFMRGDEVKKF
jgi:Zn-dependent protease with chaperone function